MYLALLSWWLWQLLTERSNSYNSWKGHVKLSRYQSFHCSDVCERQASHRTRAQNEQILVHKKPGWEADNSHAKHICILKVLCIWKRGACSTSDTEDCLSQYLEHVLYTNSSPTHDCSMSGRLRQPQVVKQGSSDTPKCCWSHNS